MSHVKRRTGILRVFFVDALASQGVSYLCHPARVFGLLIRSCIHT
ncbi:MAG TPA: hypothetical protein V6D26_27645 [Stenomitos sp.]